MNQVDWKTPLLILIPGTLWGMAFILTEVALETIPPFTLTFWRGILTSGSLLGLMYYVGGRLPRGWHEWWPYVVMGALNNGIPFVLTTWGQVYIESGRATILVSTMPLFTVILAHFFTTDEKLNRFRSVGIALGLVGVLTLIGPSALNGDGGPLWAQTVVIISALSYAAAAIFSRFYLRARKSVSAHPLASLMEISAAQYSSSTLMLMPLSLLFDRPWGLQPSAASLGALVALATVFTVTAVLIYFYLIQTAGAGLASTSVYLIPINGVVWGALLLGELITWRTVLALLLILIGVIIANRKPRMAVIAPTPAAAD